MLLLARHGQTPSNAERRFQGQAPVGLTDLGVQQAHALASHAAQRGDVAALISSPLPRARRTADAVATRLGLEVREDPRLMEHDVGDWTGRLMDDVEAEEPAAYAAYHATDPAFAFPGGESLRGFQERVVGALLELDAAATVPTLVVCHRGVVRAVRCRQDPRGLASFMDHDVANGELAELGDLPA